MGIGMLATAFVLKCVKRYSNSDRVRIRRWWSLQTAPIFAGSVGPSSAAGEPEHIVLSSVDTLTRLNRIRWR